MMQTRREVLKRSGIVAAMLIGAGLLPGAVQAYQKNAFDAKSMEDVFKALGLPMPQESAEVTLTAPDIAENGAVVPMTMASSLSGVKKMLLLVEKNPSPLIAQFMVNSAVDIQYQTRAKMGESCDVYAVAVMADGKTWFARKEVKVTLGGCGG
jgi:sulfur-oxidizing protein SoxY